jgi:hypothetical protein
VIKRLAVLAAAALLLGGCVLQSREPLYADNQLELALGKVGGTTETASLRDGTWVIDNERAVIAVEGRHYVVRGKTDVTLHFAKLKGSWFVVQGRENNGPAAYLLAEVKDRVAEVRPLLCKTLAKNHAVEDSIAFIGEDCSVKTGVDAKKLFTSLAKKPGDPVFRLQIIH